MDIWEANSMDTAYTAHVCRMNGQYRCNSSSTGNSSCGDIAKNRYTGTFSLARAFLLLLSDRFCYHFDSFFFELLLLLFHFVHLTVYSRFHE
jgi:hypothetical protein